MVKCHTLYTERTPRVLRCGAALMVLYLAACAPKPSTDVEIGFRNPTVTLAGTTRFDVTRFAGSWESISCLGPCARQVEYAFGPEGGLQRLAKGETTTFQVSAPGVLRSEAGDVLVVMWVDDGYRTAAIGAADGSRAAILNRGKVSADRVQAAREILDFNGWDVRRLTGAGGG